MKTPAFFAPFLRMAPVVVWFFLAVFLEIECNISTLASACAKTHITINGHW
jgi:hypothetical protein